MRSFQFLPTCCYYPSTVLMVDDNLDLLKDLSFALMSGRHKFKSKYSTAPREIIDILIRQGNTLEQCIKKYTSVSEEYFEPSKSIINIDIPAIHQLIYAKPIRFAEHLVLVVDFAMPDMSGLELCRKIRQTLNLPIKIIMLTGEADQMTAIQAFNDKLIDRFVVKSSSDYIIKLLQYLHELQTEYFTEVTHAIIESSQTYQNSLRKNPTFIQLFNKIAHQSNAVEYYMLDESGSFLFLDAKMQVTRLIVKAEDDMRLLLDIAENDRHTPTAIIEGLKKKEKLAYFPVEKSAMLPAKEWRLLDAKPLPNKEGGYYAILKGVADYPLESQELVSYHEFLNTSL